MHSAKSIEKFQIELFAMLNVLGNTGFFALCWFLFYSKKLDNSFSAVGNIIFLALFTGIYFLCFSVYGTNKISITLVSELIYDQVLSLLITDCISYIMIALICRSFQSIYPMLLLLAAQSIYSIVWALSVNKWYFATHQAQRTVIVWDSRQDIHELINQYDHEKRYNVLKTIHVKDCIDNLSEYLEQIDAVFLSGVHSRDRNKIIKYCVSNNIDAYVIPRVGDVIMSGAEQLYLYHLPVMKVEQYSPTISFLATKRLFDILVSLTALIVLAPLMIIIAVIIKATDGGTVFYKQLRLTKDGKTFYIYKFRSMRMDAEKDGVARLSTGAADDRITPIGRVIRATRIDELPQLINILKGDMAIVGPRPERPEIAAEYEEIMPEFRLRLQAKAGLTGYAQVHGKYNTTPYDKLLMDLAYISNPSFAADLKICLETVKILFMAESTEGVSVEQTTALSSKEQKH